MVPNSLFRIIAACLKFSNTYNMDHLYENHKIIDMYVYMYLLEFLPFACDCPKFVKYSQNKYIPLWYSQSVFFLQDAEGSCYLCCCNQVMFSYNIFAKNVTCYKQYQTTYIRYILHHRTNHSRKFQYPSSFCIFYVLHM